MTFATPEANADRLTALASLTPGQRATREALARLGGRADSVAIIQRAGYSRSVVLDALARMERAGLVRRVPRAPGLALNEPDAWETA